VRASQAHGADQSGFQRLVLVGDDAQASVLAQVQDQLGETVVVNPGLELTVRSLAKIT